MIEPVLFHLAFPVRDLDETIRFYVEGLGCTLGRRSANAMTLGLAGHQLVAHLTQDSIEQKGIYPRHFGLVFQSESDWQALAERAKKKRLVFYQERRCRFPGMPVEHLTFFLQDPSGNLLEFKHYRNPSAIFGEGHIAQVGDVEGID